VLAASTYVLYEDQFPDYMCSSVIVEQRNNEACGEYIDTATEEMRS
jgi:hypothetical protein